MIELELSQGTQEWRDARRCKVTGTRLAAVMGTPAARRALIAELIAEEATEQSKTIRPTEEMERGTNEEAFAVKWFEARTKKKTKAVGMLVSSEYDWLALSPDRVIPIKGKYREHVEVKCPDSKKAILYRIENTVPAEELGLVTAKGEPTASAPFLGVPADYKWQVVQNFLVNPDLERLYFIVYDARFISDDAKLYTVTIEREDSKMQKALAEAKAELELFRADWMRYKELVLPDNF